LATKSIAELLRLRKESHSLISQAEMKQLWDACLVFTQTMEGYGNNTRAVSLRSTLVGQAKAWLDRTHESNMSSLVAALESERWAQCEVTIERQIALTRLCTGLATVSTPVRTMQDGSEGNNKKEKNPTAVVEGVNYKVVWSCLLLVEMIMTNLAAAGHFQSLALNAVTKVVDLLRLWNSRTTNLVLGAGAIHSAARLKSINAKHLSYVTQCLGMMMALLPHIRAALMAQLPAKQHTLLSEIDKIKKEYQDHNEKVLNKFVSIIGGIVEHGLAPRIANTDFAKRETEKPIEDPDSIPCCAFLEGISNSTKKLHQVLISLLPPDHLQDVFSRIFAYLDEKIPGFFIAATSAPNAQQNGSPSFQFPSTDDGKHRLLLEVRHTTKSLNALEGVLPWDFTAVNVLERRLDYTLPESSNDHLTDEPETMTILEDNAGSNGEEKEDIFTSVKGTESNSDGGQENQSLESNESEMVNGSSVSTENISSAVNGEDSSNQGVVEEPQSQKRDNV
jgi:vacuolar protein sorting-associated protein 54